MQQINYIALAVPLFFAGLGLEIWLARRRNVRVYRLNDAINDMSTGIAQQLALLFLQAPLLAVYARVYDHRLAAPATTWSWLIAFVGVEFLYYWWHRLSHEVNLLWAAHVVHHQSEDYNLAVALRQAVLTTVTSLPFYLPLALVGVPPLIYAAMLSFSTLYQFWIHTQLIKKLPRPIEWLLNTPSHHRVHHASNPQYLDKNHGGILIVWDRLFGTYAEEVETPRYGLTVPLASFDPLWAQIHYFVETDRLARTTGRWWDRVLVWLRSPAWRPASASKPAPAAEIYNPVVNRPRLALGVFVGALVVAFVTLLVAPWLPALAMAAVGLAVLAALQYVGWLVDGKTSPQMLAFRHGVPRRAGPPTA
jgi:sterol desaturase/sphingolipid hydroxylase (fatty acid hydroxylase superfamily)